MNCEESLVSDKLLFTNKKAINMHVELQVYSQSMQFYENSMQLIT